MKAGLSTYDAMTKQPVVVSPETNLKKCAEIMAKNKVNSLLVKQDGTLLGIVTDEDFVRKAVINNLNMDQTKASDIMINEVVTIEPDKDIRDAIKLMSDHNIRQLPVVNNNELVGLLTWKDIMRVEPALFDIYAERLKLLWQDRNALTGNVIEGICENCQNKASLSEVYGQLLCSRCEGDVR